MLFRSWTLDDLQWLTVNAMKSAFISFNERLDIINTRIKPAYAALKEAESATTKE